MNTSRKLVLFTLVALAATAVFAKDKPQTGESELRTVRGAVVDKDESPVDSAVVYLKNARTQDIVTHISDPNGQFRFTGLDLNVDYEIHAERDGLTSSSHTVSSFDTRKDLDITLKLDHKKTGK